MYQAKSKCDLVKALNSISINYTVPCKYDDIDGISSTIFLIGIILLGIDFINLILVLIFPALDLRGVCTKVCICIVVSIFLIWFCILRWKLIFKMWPFLMLISFLSQVLSPIVSSIFFIVEYKNVSSLKTKDNDVVCIIFCQCRNFFFLQILNCKIKRYIINDTV